MTDLEPGEPTLCQRLCCCRSVRLKEPSVQFVKSEKLQSSSKPNGHISPAEQTIDGFQDVNLEEPTPDRSQARTLVGKATNDDLIINDIMMDEIIGDDKAEDVDTVIEDAISIRTDVVEEVDEVELSRLQLQSQSSEKQHDRLGDEKELDAPETKEEKRSQTSPLEYPSTSKMNKNSTESMTDSTDADKKVEEGERTDEDSSDLEEDDTANAGPSSAVTRNAPSSTIKKVGTSSTTSTSSNDGAESDEGISINDAELDIQRKSPSKNLEMLDLPSTVPTSIMYVDTSSDETSDDEESHEIIPPIQRPQGIVNIHDVLRVPPNSLPEANDKSNGNVLSTDDVGTNLFNKTNSDETEKTTEKESMAVTRIALGDDSSPTNQFSSVVVKMNFDAREAMTDEEFSEKLI